MTDPSLPTYTLKLINDSPNPWSFCVCPSLPEVNIPETMSLAWLVAKAAPTTQVTLEWKPDLGFAWVQIGTLPSGEVTVTSSQVWKGGLEQNNQITFTTKHGLPTFTALTDAADSGSLYIKQDRRVRAGKSMVGLAVAGSPAHLLPAQPNVELIFTPKPAYWITFGRHEQGDVLDFSEINTPAKIEFAPDRLSVTARLSSQNLWSIQPSDQL